MLMPDRIRARAIRRCGESLKQLPAEKGGDRRSEQRIASGTLNRTSAATDAGCRSIRRTPPYALPKSLPSGSRQRWKPGRSPARLVRLQFSLVLKPL